MKQKGLVMKMKALDSLKGFLMKRYLKDFKFSENFIYEAILDCFNDKWNRKDVLFFLSRYTKKWLKENKNLSYSFNDVVKLVKKTIKIDKSRLFVIIRHIAKELYQEIVNKDIKLVPINYEERVDGSNHKVRMIGISSIKQQIYDYIIVNACKKMFNAKIGYYQCASLPNKGQLFGKRTIESWIRKNPKKCKYVFKADVRKYYPSVSHDILKSLLKRDIKNDTILYVLYSLIDTYKEGLCIGSYLSQYLANYYLSYAYHYISENHFVERRGKKINMVSHVLFYMDDIIIFSSSKKNLKKIVRILEEYLAEYLNLEIKPSWQLFKLDSRPIDMMGYKMLTYKTTIRKKIFKRANKVFKKIKKNNLKMNLRQAYKVVSYYGYFKHSFSKKYIEKMKVEEILLKSKELISYYAKTRILWRETASI